MKNFKRIFLFFFSFQLLFSLSLEKLEEAKGLLQKGVDSWDQSLMEKARGIFLTMILTEKEENPYLYYYISPLLITDSPHISFQLKIKEKQKSL